MLSRFFSRRESADSPEETEEPVPAGPRRAHGISLGWLWVVAFLFSAAIIGGVGFFAYQQLTAQLGNQSKAALQAQGDRLAAEIDARLQGLTDVVDRAAAQPGLAAVMAGGDPALVAAQADAVAAAIPGALRVRLLPPGANQIDETLSPRLGYAGLDLARQAESGKRPPLEIHWPGAPDQYIAIARPIGAPGGPAAGVLLAAVDPKLLDGWLKSALPEGAYAEVRQAADGETVIAARGDSAWKGRPALGSAKLAGTHWQLDYWLPAKASLSTEAQIAFLVPFAAAAGVLGLLFAVLGMVDRHLVRDDLIRLVTHFFNLLQRKRDQGGHTVRLKEFREAVEVIDERLHLPPRRQVPPPAEPSPPVSSVPENPLFLPQDTIKVEEVDPGEKQ